MSASRATLDRVGVQDSLYSGDFFRSSQEDVRRCIVKRESEGYYTAVNGTGKYRGAYQMSPELARGVTYMMMREHRRVLGSESAKEVLSGLRDQPINRWPRYWQDAAFYTIFNWEHDGSGAAHWAGGRWHC